MKRLTTEEYIMKAIEVHGNTYDYSNVVYVNRRTNVKITCKKHGDFKLKPVDHLSGCGCPKCRSEKIGNMFRLKKSEFIEKAKLIHGDNYSYENVDYKNTELKVCIVCSKHGMFFQTPHKHLSGSGCPICNESSGERKIRRYLEENNILFEQQKRFDDCRNTFELPFDFYLPKQNVLIEYDGRQHYEPVKAFGGEESFEKRKENDMIKNSFAKKSGIDLIRIPYFEYNNVEQILNNIVFFSFFK
jgi:very-short-patch-repair endonuclease